MRGFRDVRALVIGGVFVLAAALVCGLVAGCGSSQVTYTIGDGAFGGEGEGGGGLPSMSLERGAMTRIARFTVPTGGWSVRLDRTERVFGGHRAFVTLVKPSPGTMTTQALVTHSVNLETPRGEDVAVYARMIERSVEAESDVDRVYRFAGGDGMSGEERSLGPG